MTEIEINNTEDLNEQLGKIISDPSANKPTEEEVEIAKKEFEEAAKEWTEKVYEIGKAEEAEEIGDYVIHYLRNRFLWQKDAWMGVIKLNQEMTDAQNAAKTLGEPLKVGYQAMEFIYYMLSNPGGIGLQAALDFESERDVYIKSALAVEEQVQAARKNLKDVEFLQQKWGAMAQGFYLEEEDAPIDEDQPMEDFPEEGTEQDI